MKNFLKKTLAFLLTAATLLSVLSLAVAADAAASLSDYVRDTSGTIEISMTDDENEVITTPVKGGSYRLTVSVFLPSGIVPGTYTYNLSPNGADIIPQGGTLYFERNNTNVNLGTWTIDAKGLLTYVFNATANMYTEVRIFSTFGITIKKTVTSVTFGAKYYLTGDSESKFIVFKSGNIVLTDGDGYPLDNSGNRITETGAATPQTLKTAGLSTKAFYWTIKINDSNPPVSVEDIVGKTVTDWVDEYQIYSDVCKSCGVLLSFRDELGVQHSVRLTAENGLVWDPSGKSWSYTFPAMLDGVEVKNNYKYTFKYFSAPDYETMPVGRIPVTNNVRFDREEYEHSATLYVEVTAGGVHAEKQLVDYNPLEGTSTWLVAGSLPARSGVAKCYSFTDTLSVTDKDGNINGNFPLPVSSAISDVELTVNGMPIPELSEANPAFDEYAYEIRNIVESDAIPDDPDKGLFWQFSVVLLHKCDCTASTCANWQIVKCMNQVAGHTNYCTCWTANADVNITIEYTINESVPVNEYGAEGKYIRNSVALYDRTTVLTEDIYANHEIEAVLTKTMTESPDAENKFTASYRIDLNKAVQNLNLDQVIVRDTMTNTLIYVPGSMVVTRISKTNTGEYYRTLTADKDYTVSFDIATRTLTLTIFRPGKYEYTMVYDCQAMSIDGGDTLTFSNVAEVEINGHTYKTKEEKKTISSFFMNAVTYSISILKLDEADNQPLSGAIFGLYSSNNELIASSATDAEGKILFRTNVTDGLILRAHSIYYIVEMEAPVGYIKDENTFTFYFCDAKAGDAADSVMPSSAVRVYQDDEVIFEKKFYNTVDTGIGGRKVWDDNNNAAGLRPESVFVVLYADGVAVDFVETNSSANWEFRFEHLPKFKNGQPIVYTVGEIVPDQYHMVVTSDAIHGYTITNIYEEIDIPVQKIWDDDNDRDGIRPDSIRVALYANGTFTGKIAVLSSGNLWKYTFTDLPKYANDAEINYTIQELDIDVADYTVVITGSSGVGFILINTHEPELTEKPVRKVWVDDNDRDGKRPTEILVTLLADGVPASSAVLSSGNNWQHLFTDLLKYRNGGTEIVYTATEETIIGYSAEMTVDSTGILLTNTHVPGTVSMDVLKIWKDSENQDGIRPSDITVVLRANGVTVSSAVLSSGNNWRYTFADLPEYENKALIVYTVAELTITGYESVITGSSSVGFVIENRHETEKTEIPVWKVWEDDNNRDGKRPAEIRVNLFANSSAISSAILSSGNNWHYVFAGLDKYKSGAEIVYSVTEDSVAGYSSAIASSNGIGFVITNSYPPERTEIPVQKIWDDKDDKAHVRPAEITVELLSNGVETGKTVVLSSGNNWYAEFTDLYKYENGVKISYTVKEQTISGYKSEVVQSGSVFYIRNTYTDGHTEIPVEKIWDDDGDRDGLRPVELLVTLYADGVVESTAILSSGNNWKYTFENLPEYRNNQKLVYTVTEETIAGYSSTEENKSGAIIFTNKHTPEETEVTVSKQWEDDGDRDGKRPLTLVVNLYADGTPVSSAILSSGNDWTYKFTHLPKNSGGIAIVYTVDEESVAGYSKVITPQTGEFVFLIVNTYTPEKIRIPVYKIWDDADNQDGIRATEVQVILLADGVETGKSVVLSAGNVWSSAFENLNKYADHGREIVYTVKEATVSGYSAVITGSAGVGFTISNVHIPLIIDISVQKVWSDAIDQDGFRPESITVRLHADGTPVSSAILSSGNAWFYTFTGLPVNKNGKKIVYTVTEDSVSGYTVKITSSAYGFVIENSHVPEETEFTVIKLWDDADNQDGKRPETLTITLLADGQPTGKTAVLSSGNNWTYKFEHLPKRNNGTVIKYTATEPDIPGYTGVVISSSATGFTFKNTHTPGKVSIPVEKIWSDAIDQDGIRHASVIVRLFADGTEVASTALDESNLWKYTFADLDEYKNGTKIVYTVNEDTVTGYVTTIVASSGIGFVITNTHTPEETQYSVYKIWNDKDNQDGIRPSAIAVTLLADGKPVASKNLTAAGSWNVTFDHLPKYSNGIEISYSAVESGAVGYVGTVTSSGATGIVFTNTHSPETVELPVEKIWNDANNQDGKRTPSVTVRLYADGVEVSSAVLSSAYNWKYNFASLDKFKSGKVIVYTLAEDAVAGYSTRIVSSAVSAGIAFTVENTHTPGKVSVSALKVWDDKNNQDGIRPSAITVKLFADGAVVSSAVLSSANNWKYTFDGLDEYKNGVKIVYEIREATELQGYTVTVTSSGYAFTVTNVHKPLIIEIPVEKVWNDVNNQDGKRVPSVTVRLYANGTEVSSAILSSGNNWKYNFASLDKFKDGKVIEYTLSEDAVEGYSTRVVSSAVSNGIAFTVENSHTPGKVSVSALKVWDDKNDQDGIRPSAITVNLYADGVIVSSAVLSSANSWTYSFDGLDEYVNSTKVVYEIREATNAPGYTVTVTSSGYAFTVTNVHKPLTIEIPVEKIWNDANNQDGKRAPAITVRLYADGVLVSSAVLSSANNWKYNFASLDKYKAGKIIVYTLSEDAVAGYATNIVSSAVSNGIGFTVENTHTPEKTRVEVEKVWADSDDNDAKRPVTLTVYLYADGSVVSTAILSSGNNWKYTFNGLDKYNDGKAIVYNVTEDTVERYSLTVTSSAEADLVKYKFTLTNTHNDEKTSVEVEKVWADNNNNDGKRPATLKVYLYADGSIVSSAILSSGNNWKYTFAGLDKYNDGTAIVYNVTEDTVERYSLTVTSSAEADLVKYKFTLTNTHNDEKTKVEVEKVWVDNNDHDAKRPESVTVHLYKNGVDTGSSAVLSSANNWKYTFTGLDKYENGKAINYSIVEDDVDKYTVVITSSAEADLVKYSFTVTNTHNDEKTRVEVEKVWTDNENQDGKRPTSVKVHLYADGVEISSAILSSANNWKYTFEGLDKYKDGKAIRYEITEDAVALYSVVITSSAENDLVKYIFTVNNTHAPEKTKVEVEKIWVDNNNHDGKRPVTLTVYLYADGQVVSSAILSSGNNWKYTFANVDKYKNGKAIVYNVTEETVERYSLTVTSSADADLVKYSFTLTNTHNDEKTRVEVEKIWADNDNNDGKRPTTLTVYLYADGSIVSSAVLSSGNNWKYTFNGLDKYNDGKAIVYNVTEDTVERYSLTVTSSAEADLVKYKFTLTNTHNDEKTKVEVEKIWADNDNNDGKRPVTLTVYLYADGQVVSSAILSSGNNWKYTFNGLDKYNDGKAIVYNVTEDTVERYSLTVTSSAEADLVKYKFTLTNTHNDEKTSVEVEKVWADNNNNDGKRPATLKVYLYADGSIVSTAILSSGNNWKYSFNGLDKYNDGTAIVYNVTEDTVERYSLTVTSSAEADLVKYEFTLTNTHDDEKTKVEVEKVWADNNNNDGKRPLTLTVYLYADGQVISSAILSSGNNWKYSFNGLDKYNDGKAIVYDITEDTVERYYLTVTSSADADLVKYSFTLTNTHNEEKTSVEVEKVWADNDNNDGKRPLTLTVYLYADGQVVSSAILNSGNNWKYTFANVDKYDDGRAIVYNITEETVERYSLTVTSSADADLVKYSFTLTNTHNDEKTRVEVEKVWADNDNNDGKRPTTLTVYLYADGTIVSSAVLSSGNNWKYTFAGLDKYNDGKTIVYDVTEDTVERYILTVTSSAETDLVSYSFTLTNSYENEKTQIKVEKIWVDNNDQDGMRPDDITVELLADGKVVSTAILSSGNSWNYTFEKLNKLRDGGIVIVYTIKEQIVPEYSSAITSDGIAFIIENTHEIRYIDIPVEKIWTDGDNRDGIRPVEIVVKLIADGKFTGKMILLSDENAWKDTFTHLEEYKDGKKIVYTVQEVAVTGYTPVITSSGFGFIIENIHEPEITRFPVRKVWVDGDNRDGARPVEITVKLLADGVYTGKSVVLSSGNNWESSFENLEKYSSGILITYSVEEIKVKDYTVTVLKDCHGFTITNTYEPEETELPVWKVWVDGDNQDGIRPDSIVVLLYADGEFTGKAQILSSGNSWSAVFRNLDKYKAGKQIVYTVMEQTVAGYTTVITSSGTGFVIENTHEPEITRFPVRKVWVDGDNKDGIRPAQITVKLLADGVYTGKSVVLSSGNNWESSFENLAKYASGKLINYTVEENEVDGYTVTVLKDCHGFTITNTYVPKTVDLPVEKIWKDNDNQDGIRPANITVRLLADGVEVSSAILNLGNNWKYTFTNLPENRNLGVKIVYTVAENAVEGYTVTVTSSGYGIVLTNTHSPEKTEIPAKKLWNDENDADKIRPAQITVKLLADGTDTGKTLVLSSGNNWNGKFEDLPVYKSGKKIVYTVKEIAVTGYSTRIEGSAETGFVITNTHTVPKLGNLVITKVVVGMESDRAFSFRVDFSAAGTYRYVGTFGGEVVSGAIASGDTILMKHGDRIEIFDLPAGTTYEVTETDNGGFSVYAEGWVGIILPQTKVYAAFTNNVNPPTGDNMLLWCFCGTIALAACGTLVYRKKKKDAFED